MPDRRQQRRWVPVAAGWLVFLVGVADIIEGVTPLTSHIHIRLTRIAHVVPGTVAGLTRLVDVIIGLLLLMLSHGLRRRKHRAWQEAMALLIISVAVSTAHVVALVRHDVMIIGAGVALGLLAGLVIGGFCYRGEFYAVGDPRTRWRALGALVGLLAADMVIGLSYIALRGLSGPYTVPQRVQAVLYGLVGVSPPAPLHFVQEGKNDIFGLVTGGLGFITVLVTAYLFLRPAEPPGRLNPPDAARVRELLDRHGDADSLGYFALRDDKSVIWSATGKSCIGYRVLSGVMLASGDPLGDSEAWPGAIQAFLAEAARHAWVPAVVGCSERGAEVWCREGDLTALELGDEAIVEVADFSLQGRAMRNVRQMVTRVCRAGYVAQVRRVGDVPAEEITRLVRQADSWRGSPTERGFSMALGRIGGAGDENCVLATAMQDGVLRALLHFVPWGDDGLSLDLMRRDRSAQPGLNDFMIVETIKAAQDLGVKHISLNFAVFRAALERGERIGAGPILRVWRRFLVFMSRWFQIESLYKFNAKFAPQWVPRFMVFPGTRDAIRIGLAALEAEAFLVWPTIELRRIARKARAALWRAVARPARKPGAAD
ncbi:MAG TPA: phosphatidylglycerol lysyltransferase domain-containing protein [Streptosporangiaceae bacterium]|nr:phosphatidylglycerol lysyltransferase domain-containing protein [Streptosporangiaceae bacterium]